MNTAIQWSDLLPVCSLIALLGGFAWRVSSVISAVRRDLDKFKLEVAQQYVSATSMRAFEDRISAAIERLGDRLDHVFEKSLPR